jgi:hypothetical protein
MRNYLGRCVFVSTRVYTPVSIRNLKQIHTAAHPGALEKKPPADSQPTNEEAQQKAIWPL